MIYLRIREWKKFQHYKDRDPPWIKLHRELLTSRTWVSLDDASRVLAVALMLLAAGTDNKIPADKAYLKRVAYLNDDPDWTPLLNTQFIDLIDDCESPLAHASETLADDTKCSSEERRDRAEKNVLAAAPPARKQVSRGTAPSDPEWFLDFKLAYPNRHGDQGWRKALRAANARMAEGFTADDFIAGAKRYAAHCAAAGKVGTEYVKQAATFLGPDKPFLEPWPTTPTTTPREERSDRFRSA